MAIGEDDLRAWADAYIEGQQDPSILQEGNPFWWAVNKFWDSSAEDCWLAILQILSKDPPPAVVGVLAAGPLEDLIHDQGLQFIERIETEARRNAAFRRLLCGVWKSSSPEIWARVLKARDTAQ